MSTKLETFYTTIASGSSVSSIFTALGGRALGLIGIIPTSCSVYLQASWNTTSADFSRVSKVDGTGVWAWNVGSGRAAVSLEDVAPPFQYFRVETGVAQADTSSLALVVKV